MVGRWEFNILFEISDNKIKIKKPHIPETETQREPPRVSASLAEQQLTADTFTKGVRLGLKLLLIISILQLDNALTWFRN